jgi:hypothetical protein
VSLGFYREGTEGRGRGETFIVNQSCSNCGLVDHYLKID